jgi:hypothetical protein
MAYHEAGHVVAGRRFGHPIESVSIEIERGKFGDTRSVRGMRYAAGARPEVVFLRCSQEGIVEEGDEEILEEVLVGFWAGPAAQKKFRPESVHPAHAETDLRAIRRCVNALCRWTPRRKRGMIAGIKRRAEALMDDPAVWAQVVVLAAALANKGELTGAQVEAILREASLGPG